MANTLKRVKAKKKRKETQRLSVTALEYALLPNANSTKSRRPENENEKIGAMLSGHYSEDNGGKN